jgi:pyrimidine operon attenuation protein/uracil phosphoribosyltransferase
MRNIQINPCDTIFNRTRQFIAYVDDVAITGRTVRVLTEVLTQLQTAAVSTGLVPGTDKTKCMKTKNPQHRC